MNPDLALLKPYPFERLAKLLEGASPPDDRPLLRLSIGEPQHAPPAIVLTALRNNLDLLAKYPTTRGDLALREAQASWMCRRHGLQSLDPDSEVLPVNGTREALFAIAQACVGQGSKTLVGSPNPFYQIYEGAALLAGARCVFLNTVEAKGFLPDPDALSRAEWEAMELLYLCTPGNPAGAVMDTALLQRFIHKAIEHNVVLVSDECYSEIYPDESAPPTGLLAACTAMGLDDFQNCISMHSLSKRSNLPGLRSGFAAGDKRILAEFLRYRGYHGSAMPPHHQLASTVAWSDEEHVRENRDRYREKFAAVGDILAPVLSLNDPGGGFYLWPTVPLDDESFTRRLYDETGVLVLPGSYLSHEVAGLNPGSGRVRMALVAELSDCIDAAQRIAAFVRGL
ncbi:succinyldiaminopimelate transaminase [Congregibacter litoralis]|uniref:Succinyldiaminopimelate aminotransferase apoenzyme n=1 Tax=Congregibacter litoralis KT71 TaxID=314285 RepID=A4ACI4_9GAMM|nr:succinyldiaminopimelate transaminase [Congregibacter litoralis]EAQ96198.1 succinyldiaminopimelate aminotransferase apoenzyme [Congregibacter litoralis KT71]